RSNWQNRVEIRRKGEGGAGLKYFLYLMLIVILAAGAYAAWMWYGITYPYQGFPKEGVFVDVPHGASRRYVAFLLKQNGVVRSKLAFEIYARRHPKRTLEAGEYFFDYPMTGRDVVKEIFAGLQRAFGMTPRVNFEGQLAADH